MLWQHKDIAGECGHVCMRVWKEIGYTLDVLVLLSPFSVLPRFVYMCVFCCLVKCVSLSSHANKDFKFESMLVIKPHRSSWDCFVQIFNEAQNNMPQICHHT